MKGPRLQTTKNYRGVHVNGRTVRLHVIRAERALGKPLPPKAVVHHADGSKSDDAPLVICQDQGYHRLLHARMKVQRAGGNPNTDAFCGHCRTVKPLQAFGLVRKHRHNGRYGWCRTCSSTDQSQRYHRKRAAQRAEMTAKEAAKEANQ